MIANVSAHLRAAADTINPQRCVGIDLGKKLALCEVRAGQVVSRATLSNRAELERTLGPQTQPARVAIESCRETWFYYDLLTGWGHKVLVVDTTRVRQLGIGQHKRKNDRIDAELLAHAVHEGRIPLAHVLSPARRDLRTEIAVRRALVETRTNLVVTVRGQLRAWGIDIAPCDPENFASNVLKLVQCKGLPDDKYTRIEPLVGTLIHIEPRVRQLDKKLAAIVDGIDIGKVLMTCPGVGTVVAASFISVIDEAGRFRTAHQVESYLGLVPSENTSGKRRLGSITKAGNCYLRAMLVQAAWGVLRARQHNALKLWGQAIADRKGKRVAVVAVARRLAGILWAMWRDGTEFDPGMLARDSAEGLRKQARRVRNTARALEGGC